jgi:hypothetical protein
MRIRPKGLQRTASSGSSGLTEVGRELRFDEATAPAPPEQLEAAGRLLATLLLRGLGQQAPADIPLDVPAPPKVVSAEE